MIRVSNQISREDALLGIVRAEGVRTSDYPIDFESDLEALLEQRATPLSGPEEEVRRAARDLLRNGSYKPTGRGKPASEYLVRAARRHADAELDGSFPRINAPVDVCNYISLRYLLPISLWDLDLASTTEFVFRLGKKGESFVFNTGGQRIDLEDLVVGCAVLGERQEPIVNPVKDSLATKTTGETRNVAACVYAPGTQVGEADLEEVCLRFASYLEGCGEAVDTGWRVLASGGEAHL